MINKKYSILTAQGRDFDKISGELLDHIDTNETPLRFAFFGAPKDSADYLSQLEIIIRKTRERFGHKSPVISYIAQKPLVGVLKLEATLLDNEQSLKIDYHNNYIVINGNSWAELITGGILANSPELPIYEQSSQIFAQLSGILSAERFEIDSIVRQWNYIEDITGCNGGGGCDGGCDGSGGSGGNSSDGGDGDFNGSCGGCESGCGDGDNGCESSFDSASFSGSGHCRQNYQEFNDARSEFYAQSKWPLGYPAATGIGTQMGGVMVELNAIKGASLTNLAVDNSLQIAAHQYSKEVLIGEESRKSTPKFERARVIGSESGKYVAFISGTAAIRGEQSVANGDIIGQTALTMENIDSLISAKNTKIEGVRSYKMLRVYIKNPEHLEQVRKYMNKNYAGVPKFMLYADICRHELLIEIEGIAEITK